MLVKIRHETDTESTILCAITGPDKVEDVVKSLARAGGVLVRKNGETTPVFDPSKQLRYDFILTEKQFYAEIVVHDDPQA